MAVYYKMRQLLQSTTAILLYNASVFNHKMRVLLQNAIISDKMRKLLQIATVCCDTSVFL